MVRRLTPGWRLRATLAAVCLPPLVHAVPLDRLARWSSRRAVHRQADDRVDDAALAEWVDRVLDWLPWPWRRTCLKRSLALYALLARAGRPVELRVGVRRGDDGALAAHAWLTRGGEPVLEPNPAALGRLQVIDSYLVPGAGA